MKRMFLDKKDVNKYYIKNLKKVLFEYLFNFVHIWSMLKNLINKAICFKTGLG